MTHPAPDRLFLDFQAAVAGRYSLERELGRGGMGVVYLAREVRLDRPVAIKLLPPSKASDPKLRERFLREARTAAKLSHPNIIPIFSVEESGDFVFFAMGYVDGEPLPHRVPRRGPLAPSFYRRPRRPIRSCASVFCGRRVPPRSCRIPTSFRSSPSKKAAISSSSRWDTSMAKPSPTACAVVARSRLPRRRGCCATSRGPWPTRTGRASSIAT